MNLISSRHVQGVRESAAIAALAFTFLEGIAHTLGAGFPGGTHSIWGSNLVGETASVTAVTFSSLELEADAGRAGTEITVRESAHVATVTLSLLKCKARSSLALLATAKVGESTVATGRSASVGEAAVVATIALALLEGIALLHAARLFVASRSRSPCITTAHRGRSSSHIVRKSATITTIAFTLLEGEAGVGSARSIGRHGTITTLVRKSASISTSAFPCTYELMNENIAENNIHKFGILQIIHVWI
jgi:hypothetical protein